MACLLIVDLTAFYSSLLIAWIFRTLVLPSFTPDLPFFLFPYIHYVSLWWIPAVFIFFIFYEGLYERNLPFWDETKEIVISVSLASITLMAIVTLGKMAEMISRLILLGLWISSLFAFPLFRLWGKKILHSIGICGERILIIGAGNAGRLVLEGLQRERHMGYHVIGFLDDDEQKMKQPIQGKRVFGKISDFSKFTAELEISRVIIAIPSLHPDKLSALTAYIQNSTINTMLIPDLKGIALLNTDLFHLFTEELFLMNIRNNLKSIPNRFVKRFFDITFSLLSLPIILPLIALIAIIIRIGTPGSAIYAHERIGKDGIPFRCYKFRTMDKDAEERLKEILHRDEIMRNEWLNNWKLKDDPRITKIGKFLRKTSLDELPQIFNVLQGEMSLIGPRPYLPREKVEIAENTHIITSAKPGITGLWQVSGRSDTGCRYRIRLDTWYVMNWSLWLDIVIILKTIKVIIRAEGAY
jgi:Undecaprenyl-phosphate galactose phosphotransferase WbaP